MCRKGGKDSDLFGHMKDPAVKFRIADEDEEDNASAETHLLMSSPPAAETAAKNDKTIDTTRV